MKESKIEAKRKFWEAAFTAMLPVERNIAAAAVWATTATIEWERCWGDSF